MKNIYRTLEKVNFIILCSAIFLFRLPPLNLLSVDSPILSTHGISRIAILLITLLNIILLYKKLLNFRLDKKLTIFIALYFLSLSASVLNSININAFFSFYKDIIIGLLIFINANILINTEEKVYFIIKAITLTVIFNLLFQYLIYFHPDLTSAIRYLFYSKYWKLVEINYSRGRFFSDIYDAALIPLLFFSIKKKGNSLSFTSIIITCFIILFTFLSNFRGHVIILLISMFVFQFTYFNKYKKASFLVIIFLFVTIYVGNLISVNFVKYSIIDRFIFPEQQDNLSILGRIDNWNESIRMGLSSPLTGIGLGNFYDNLPSVNKPHGFVADWRYKLADISAVDPHNIFFSIFAETGFLGLFSFCLLLIYFMLNDIKSLKYDGNLNHILLIESFWLFFLYSLFDPEYTIPYLATFWLLRLMIIKSFPAIYDKK